MSNERVAEIRARCETAKKALVTPMAISPFDLSTPYSVISVDIPHLLSLIAEQAAEIARLTEAQRWIPVEERLPTESDAAESMGDVAWLFPDRHPTDGRVIALPWWQGKGATHWQPLPAPPTKGE